MSLVVIGVTGKAGSGKSTLARRLVDRVAAVRIPFAKPLKSMLLDLLETQGIGLAVATRMIDGDLKEAPSEVFGGRTPRHAMQTLGTEWGRALSPTFWVDAWRRSVDRATLEASADMRRLVVVADDVRFPEEVAAIRALGGVIVRVDRPGAGLAASAGNHASETTDIGAPDVVIVNDGDLDWLYAQVEAIVPDVAD